MSAPRTVNASEDEARALAEASRESAWKGKSFLRDLFLGTLRADWIDPYPELEESPEFLAYMARVERFFVERVDSAAIDAAGEYPLDVIDGLRQLGAFGLKIPKKFGGVGLNQAEYCRVLEVVSAYDGSIAALVSAHNSIGVPQPVKLFGTPDQQERFLTRCAAGAISAFALTEPDVGSDPARLSTTATRLEDGSYELTGEKLWITNGTIAELMVVMARTDSGKISAFIVDTKTPGVSVGHRCRFMGLSALENGVIYFDKVRVPAADRIGEEGQGLKVALVTLNTGRLSLPAACVGGARRCLHIVRQFAAERVQWGAPVGHHEAISHKIADMASTLFAMESWSRLASELALREGYDIRLEAATAKEWCSTRGWDLMDDAMQIRGGRGYEKESSLVARGEPGHPIERMMRDSRINRIFEGSSEIMHLFMARELVDKHLQVAGALLDRKGTLGGKLAALPGVMAFYGSWYPGLWLRGLLTPFRYGKYGTLASHVRFAERRCRKLAREVFHGMVLYQAKLEKKQAFLFRTVDIAMELAVMVAAVARATALADRGDASAADALKMAELHCLGARRVVDDRFSALWSNEDDAKTALGRAVVDGKHTWLEREWHAPLNAPVAQASPKAAK